MLNKQFALITHEGRWLYPYQKQQRSTNRFGFALTKPGEQDRCGGGTYTTSLEEVVQRLVFEGWNVRVKSDDPGCPLEGTRGIGKRAVSGYWIAPELRSWVAGADIQPINELSSDDPCPSVSPTVAAAVMEARLGQGVFRQRLMALWQERCSVTRCGVAEVLVALHIKPWERCTEGERLDPFNGLLLSASIAKLFEAGMISFSDEGRLIVSPTVDIDVLSPLGLFTHARLTFIAPEHKQYLAVHRHTHGFF